MSSSKVAIVTGANKGIGFECVKLLAANGAFQRVYLGARDVQRGEDAVKRIADPSVRFIPIDLESNEVVAAAAALIKQEHPEGVDVLINNAGFAFNVDATEPFGLQAKVSNAVNYHGTKMVTNTLFPVLKPGGRVVNVASRAGSLSSWSKSLADLFRSSDATLTIGELDAQIDKFIAAAEKGEHKALGFPNSAYGTSKAAEIAFSRIVAKSPEYLEKGITVTSCCPGWCQTDMSSHQGNKTAAEGADTPVWLATDPSLEGQTGGFYGERTLLQW